jgi:hypothetical protein
MAKTVPEDLREKASLYEERNKLYGDNYKFFGQVMMGLFPTGIELRTPDDFNRFGVFVQMVAKMTRISQQFVAGGHPDSNDDLAVYSLMMKELEAEIREEDEVCIDMAKAAFAFGRSLRDEEEAASAGEAPPSISEPETPPSSYGTGESDGALYAEHSRISQSELHAPRPFSNWSGSRQPEKLVPRMIIVDEGPDK